ncbi:MAG: pyridoxal phosphate-dependent aminotransferase family protein [Anaerolineales bacterium]
MSLHMESPARAQTVFNGRRMDYFAGTGYLGLQAHPAVLNSAQEALLRYGLSTATSRGGYGEHPIYDRFEQEACAYFSAEKVLYFASGYLGASILTQATGDRFEHIFIDSAAHFSLWDAAYATNRPITPFHHLSPQSLAENLQGELCPKERPLVLSDGVFPVSGEIAPLPEYLTLTKPLQGLVYVDDAHAVGVMGKNGRGTTEYFNIEDESCCSSATLAKALGGFGGIIWGETGWVENLDRASRICAGASPPPLVIAAASAKALEVARVTPELRQQLWANVARARTGLRSLGWELADTPVPILCLEGRQGVSLEIIKKELFEQAIAVELVRSYTSTPPGGALRIAIFATHSEAQIDRLINAVGRLV